ncbi:MAG: putative quinol monooxygenase [Candidatus Binatia bacterium]
MCLNEVRASLGPTFLTHGKDREGKETMGNKVTVLALFKAKPGLEEEVKRELMALQGPTRSEEGCINYDLHQSQEDPSRFMFYENWKSQEDLDKHLQMPYLTAFREKAGDLLAEPTSITLHNRI